MKKSLLALTLLGLSSTAFSQSHTVSGNVSFFTDLGTQNTTQPYIIFGLIGVNNVGSCGQGAGGQPGATESYFGFEHAWSSFQAEMLLEAYKTDTKITIVVEDTLHPSNNQDVCGVQTMGYWGQ
jgi:hypothetical protein